MLIEKLRLVVSTVIVHHAVKELLERVHGVVLLPARLIDSVLHLDPARVLQLPIDSVRLVIFEQVIIRVAQIPPGLLGLLEFCEHGICLVYRQCLGREQV